ncbi:MAG: hypothetical protein OXH85_10380 [Truepera sp.]|nr:hypothetical protein [Truepera sp.]
MSSSIVSEKMEVYRPEFIVIRDPVDSQTQFAFTENDLDIGNRLTLWG